MIIELPVRDPMLTEIILIMGIIQVKAIFI